MADETEVLDWDEDDTQTPFVAADDEDAVSLGASDDELEELDDTAPPAADDIQAPPPSASPAVVERPPSKRQSSPPRHEHSSSRTRGDRDRDRDRERHRESRDSRDDRDRDRDAPRERRPHPHKLTVTQPITHALPPKPVTAVPAYMHPSHPSSIEATLMAPSTLKDAKDGTKPKPTSAPTEGKPKSGATPNGSATPGPHANLKSSSTDRDRDDEWDSRQSRTNPNSTPNAPSTSPSSYFNSTSTRPYKGAWERPRAGTGASHRDERDEAPPNGNGNGGEGGRQDEQERHYRPSSPKNGSGSGAARWTPPPRDTNPNSTAPNPNSTSGRPSHSSSMSVAPYSEGFEGSKREYKERNRDLREDRERGDPERSQRQGPAAYGGAGSSRAAFDDGERQRGYPPRPDERERRDVRDRERDQPPHPREREREPPREVASHPRETRDQRWPGARDLPPHQYERKDGPYDARKQDGLYEARKQDGRDTRGNSNINLNLDARNSNSMPTNPSLTQSQIHPRDRERDRERERERERDSHRERDPQPPIHRERERDLPPLHREREPMQREREREPPLPREREPIQRDPQPPMHREREPPLHREPQPPRSAHSIMPAPRHSRHRSRSRSMSPPGGHFANQRKREKSRFAPASEVVVAPAPSSGQAMAPEVAAAFGLLDRSMVDQFVPDELLEDSKETDKQPEPEKEHGKRDTEERDRPKRQPLPPQNAFFHEQDTGRYSKPVPPSTAHFGPSSAELPPGPRDGPRDAMPPPAARLPSGPRRGGPGLDTRGNRPPPLSMPMEVDDAPPRPPPSQPAASYVPPIHSRDAVLAGPAAPIRAGSGMYADREALATPVSGSTDGGSVPRGPRAMSSAVPTGSYGYGGPPSAFEGGFGRGRGRDRSPPPHMGGHGDRMPPRGGMGSDGYRGRGRGNPPPPASMMTSGPNAVPIGNRQSSTGSPAFGEGRYSGGPPIAGFNGEPGFSDSGYRGRGRGRARGRGRGLEMVSTYPRDSYRSENGPDTGSSRYTPPPPERNASPSYSRSKDHYEEASRFESDPPPPPPRRSNYPDSAGYPSPGPPSLSRQPSQTAPVTSQWPRQQPERYATRRPDDPHVAPDAAKPERDRYPPANDEPKSVRPSLEDRLAPSSGDRYKAPQESRPTNHPLPLNPSLRRDDRDRDAYPAEEPRQSTSQGSHPEPFHSHQPLEGERRPPFRKDQSQSDNPLFDRVGGYDDGASGRHSKIVRIRRPDPTSSLDNNSALPLDAPSVSSSHHRVAEEASSSEHAQRPPGLGRSASLLERLQLGGDAGGEGNKGGFSEEPPSLRDRVQIPSKRDWDDMGGMDSSPDPYGRDGYYDGDDDSAAKRRKKNGKPKRGRRGGPP
ncbi:hypothetical protein DFH09DRAFT_1182189 [Mycena vulgaris]|nr:hypothetical protein DFH09DRAFT_1182189 [Mycena vulgaris]